MPVKRCAKCRRARQTHHFNRSRRARDALQSYCRPCSRKAGAERRLVRRERFMRRKIWLESKTCRACRTHRASEYFPINTESKDGLGAVCKFCSHVLGPARNDGLATPFLSARERRALALTRITKANAHRVSAPCEITYEWILERLEKGRCERSGRRFVVVNRGTDVGRKLRPQVIRRDAALGYTPDNCMVVGRFGMKAERNKPVTDRAVKIWHNKRAGTQHRSQVWRQKNGLKLGERKHNVPRTN